MTSTKFILVLLLIAVNAICSEACGGGGSKPEPKNDPKPTQLKVAVPPCNCQCPKPTPCPVTTSKSVFSSAQFSKPILPDQNHKLFSHQPPAYNPNTGYNQLPAHNPNSGYNQPPAQNPNSGYNPAITGYSGYYPGYQYPNYPNYPSYPSNVPAFSGLHENEKPKNPQPSDNEAITSTITPIGFGFGVINSQRKRTEEGWTSHSSSKQTW